jgi:hypothetical protein
MGELIQQIRERSLPKKPGVLIDIDTMSEEDVARVKAELATAKQFRDDAQKNEEINKAVSAVAPGVQDAYEKILRATAAQGSESGVEIVDDRAAAATEKQPNKPEPEIPAPPKPDTSAESGVAQPDLLAPVHPAFCPRCDWDLRRNYAVDITIVDKENFMAAILGGVKFKRDYTILNGRYTVIFRTLLAEENKIIHRQLVAEQRANEFFSDTEWFLRFFEYRLACSIESIIVNDKVIALIPELDELNGRQLPAKMDDPSLPPLTRMYNYVIKELLSAEITRRLVGKQFREFQRLYEALEAMALEPNFW